MSAQPAIKPKLTLVHSETANTIQEGVADFRESATGGFPIAHAPYTAATVKLDSIREVNNAAAGIQEIDIDHLYPASAELTTLLSLALVLLNQTLSTLDSAIDYCRTGERLLADNQTHHLLQLLNELFCTRGLSEGFANIVNACQNAVRNLAGDIVTEAQLIALNSCLLAAKRKPLLSFDSSLEVVERLESAGLNVEASGMDYLVEILSDEGNS